MRAARWPGSAQPSCSDPGDAMRYFLITALWLALAVSPALAQAAGDTEPQASQVRQEPVPAAQTGGGSAQSAQDRWFFPTGWIYGYGQFDLAPPHNEPDPNLCAANSGQYGGVNSQCTAFARYLLGGHFVIHPFGRSFLQHLKFEYTPTMAFGKSVPQYLYTWSWQWIGMEQSWSAAVDLPKGFDFRMTQHFLFVQGDASKGPAYLGPNGPWGRYTTIGVRKTFGTYRDWYGAHPFN